MLNQKIKIIHIIPTLNAGGAERLVVDIAKKINKDRFEIQIVSLKKYGYFGLELKRQGIPLVCLKQKHKLSILVLIKLAKLLKDEKPSIVHLHLFGGELYGGIASRFAKIKTVISTEHNLNYNESFVRRLIKIRINKLITRVIAVSEAVKNYLVEQGIEKEKIEVIHNGIDVKEFAYDRVYENKINITIGSIGRLSKQKNYKTLIDAIRLLKNNNIKCLIAGEGEERINLEKQINKFNLNNKIKLEGVKKDIRKFLSELDIFVLPSVWEGFGLVILEAAISGLPVIASRVDGITEIINNKQTGILVAPGDASALAGNINDLAKDELKRKKIALNLQSRVINKFNIEKMVNDYERIYFNLN